MSLEFLRVANSRRWLDGSHSPPNIATHSFVLGLLAGISLAFGSFSVTPSGALYIYAGFISTFHFLEYLLTAIWKPRSVSLDSFLINHSMEYHTAHAIAFGEALVELWLYPEYKKSIVFYLYFIGLIFAAVGQLSRSLAMWQAGVNFSHDIYTTKQSDHKLVTHGIYRYVRHPAYFGFTVWVLGTQLLLGNVVCFVCFIYVLYRYFSERVEYEEKYLVEFFGDEYVEYRAKTWSGRHIYTGISRQGRIAQRHLSQDSSKKNAQLLSDDVLKAARQKMAERGFQAAEGKGAESADAAAAVESTNPLVSKVLLGGFLALVGYGSYRLCRELENEPKQISESSLLLKPIHRAHYRIMSVYKGIVDPDTDHLLPDAFPMGHPYFRPYTLVIELDKLLVHSKWSKEEGWSVQKRPYADYFLTYMSQFYEIVVFTNQIPSYAAPILDKLDGNIQSIFYRLYRDSTCYDIMSGEYVKDISIMNRDPRRVIIMDSDPRSYMHTQPENAIETKPWEGDGNDTFLFDIIPFMETLAISGLEDVRPTLQSYKGKDIPKLFKENLARVQAAQQQEYFSKSADSEQGQSSGLIGTILSWFNVEPNKLEVPASQEDFERQQIETYKNFVQHVEETKRAHEEEQARAEKEHEKYIERLKNVRVTLLELMQYGPEEAVKMKADPETRAYFEKIQAQQQAQ